jgi:ABC-type multidrug transport system fused ATPase/permease subunit
VLAGYDAVMRDRTTIMITHRPELARRADRIVVLQGGVVAEEGSPEELYEQGTMLGDVFAGT